MAMALALALPAGALAEELGEMDLYDPVIYAGEVEPAAEAAAEEAPAEPAQAGEATAPIEEATAPVEEATAPVEAAGAPEADEAAADEAEEIAAPAEDLLATALSFHGKTLKIGKGEIRPLVIPAPESAPAVAVTYASSKKSVAAVDQSGNVYGKKTGSAVITAVAATGEKAACKVKVVKAPSKVTLSDAKLVLNAGESRALAAKLPSGTASLITWASSDPAVATVDANGNVTAVGAGTATVGARTFNGKKATCKVAVLAGSAPTSLSLGATKLSLGVKEKYQLAPAVGEGQAALFAYASSKKSVATVSSKGVITAKKAGTARITVTTHNGLKATLTVKVAKAPSKVTLSASTLTLEAGRTAALAAKLPSGTASTIAWESSDEAVATVDADGVVTALALGETVIRARTFNGKSAACRVNVTTTEATAEPDPTPAPTDPGATPTPATPAVAKMAANIRASSLGGKRDAIASVVTILINAGFEPAFAAGVGANVYAEGTYGKFESSRYITNYQKRPRYFCYLDGGDYYTSKNGSYVLTAVYMSEEEMATYTGKAEARKRFGPENFYMDNFSNRYVQDIDLTKLEAFIEALAAGNWEGKFGVGIVQWTGGRTKKLVQMYRKHAGSGSGITAAQVMAAENEMILYDLKGDYANVYSAWKSANSSRDTAAAARSAGALVCTKYEIPVDKESKAVTRGNKAAEIYQIMMGN